MGQRIELEDASGEQVGITVDINFQESYDIDYEKLGAYFATVSSQRQAQFFIAMITKMKEFPIQWAYLIQDISDADGDGIFEEWLTELNENWNDR